MQTQNETCCHLGDPVFVGISQESHVFCEKSLNLRTHHRPTRLESIFNEATGSAFPRE